MNYSKTLNLPRTEFPMRAKLSEKEPHILNLWEDKQIYQKIREKMKGHPKYILHDGPPYANGDIHLGQVLNKILKDVIIKYKTMRGYDSPFIPGWDCHGLPVEHQLFKKLGITKKEISRTTFRKKARDYAFSFVKKQREEFKRLGIFGRWDKPYLTMDFNYEGEIVKSFGELAKRGYIYRGLKPIHWCFKCQTALAEAEIEYREKESPSIYVKFPLKKDHLPLSTNLPAYILIWTTTPWTLPANLAIALNPNLDYVFVEIKEEVLLIAKDSLNRLEDKFNCKIKKILYNCKGKELEGLSYVNPLNLREGRVLMAGFVSVEEGTGCVHIAPGHGEEDYSLGLKHGLPVFSPVDDEGKFTSEVKEFQGIHIFEANKLIQRKLEGKKLLLAQEKIQHSYPHCWRCGSPLIFRATPQWFLSVDKHGLREKAINSVDSKVKWIPLRSQTRMISMLKERPDWCLSRQRYWGVGIPVVYCQSCKEAIIDGRIIEKIKSLVARKGSDAWFNTEVESFLPEGFRCPKCGGKNFKKEEDIVDVWFESGISHRAVVAQEESLKYPADLYLEGSDQHRGWFQTSLLTSLSLEERPPFRCVLTHGFVVDSKGRKMSKSLGNVIDPQEIISSLGADTLRLWVSLEDYTEDIRISQEILNYTVEVYRRIRNTFRFLLGNLYDFSPEKDKLEPHQLREIDRYILSRLQGLTKKVTEKYENFKFYEAVHTIHNFTNGDLSAFYFDILKDRLYTFLPNSQGRRSAQTVLFELLLTLTKLIAPVLSFTAEEVWGYLKKVEKKVEESVFLSEWPKVKENFVDLSLEKKWDKILSVRELSLKKLEEVRILGEISSSLEAKLLIETPSSLFSLLKSLDNELKEVFIVSQIELKEAKKLKVYVEKAKGKKCQRCWNYSVYVGENKNYPYLCERCSRVLNHLLASSPQ